MIRQVVEVVTDLYDNKLCLFKLSPDNIWTHFEAPINQTNEVDSDAAGETSRTASVVAD